MSDFYLLTRAAYAKLSRPVAKASLRMGLTPDSITIIGTAGTVIAALTLFPIGQLWWGAFAVFVFVLADMLDGAMARERGSAPRSEAYSTRRVTGSATAPSSVVCCGGPPLASTTRHSRWRR